MLKIAICDDEPAFAIQLGDKIREAIPDCEIQTFFSGGELLRGGRFDICFLDIQMEGINGIETARKLREKDEESIIVFITGAREYVFEAFDVAAFHYLVKPLEDGKLQEVLRRAEREAGRRRNRPGRYLPHP